MDSIFKHKHKLIHNQAQLWVAGLGIPFKNFYRIRMKNRQEDERSAKEGSVGNFFQLLTSYFARQCNRQSGLAGIRSRRMPDR